jgi:hypothetical protein
MSCKAAGAALAVGLFVAIPGASWSETVKIPSHADGGCCLISPGSDLQADPAPTGKAESGVTAIVDESGVDRPATSDHTEGDAESLAIGDAPGADATAAKSDNAPVAMGSVANPESSTLTRLLLTVSDLRDWLFGGP